MNWKLIITILTSAAAVGAAYFFYGMWERKHGRDTMHKPQEEAGSAAPEPVIGLANPMREVCGVEDINSAIGCDMHLANGAEDEKYFVFRTSPPLGDYRFTLNGRHYILRASRTAGDITGVYVTDGTLTDALAGRSGAKPVMIEGNAFMRIFRGDMQYALYSGDAELCELAETARALKLDILTE